MLAFKEKEIKMDTKDTLIRRFTSTKFILAILVLGVLTAVALASPQALSAELVTGLLGVIATYSGSNAVLSALSMKKSNGQQAEAAPTPVVQGEPDTLDRDNILDLQNRMTQAESQIAQLIEIIKQLMPRK